MEEALHRKNFSTFEEARDAIVGEPEVAARPVRPGRDTKESSENSPEAINGGSTDSSLPDEGVMTFDILFYAVTKDGIRHRLYINLEAQRDYYPGDDLTARGVIYAARIISQQMDTEYTADNYDGVKKTYSIWICMNTPEENRAKKNVADSIVEYRMEPHTLFSGNGQEAAYGRYDLMRVVQIRLQDEGKNSRNRLIGMLSVLLSSTTAVSEKKKILAEEYNLPMTKNMEKEAAQMCNLSQTILEKGEAIGQAKGEAIGQAKGEAKGEDKLGRLITALINSGRSGDIAAASSDAEARKKLYQEFNIK